MGKLIYRICLAALLVVVVAGGVYYYTELSKKQAAQEKGTFVERIAEPETFRCQGQLRTDFCV